MSREIIQASGAITSIAVSPTGLIAYKIFLDGGFSGVFTEGLFNIGYPYVGSIDKIRYRKYQSDEIFIDLAQVAYSNIIWDNINSRFLTLAKQYISNTPYVLYSSDGINWTRATPSSPLAIQNYAHIFTFNPNKIITFPKDGTTALPLQTTDGINYSTLGSVQITSGVISSIKHPTTNRCVVYGRNIYYSDDLGETWIKSTTSHTTTMIAVIWSNYKNSYIGVDYNGNFWTSVDAVSWSSAPSASKITTSYFNTIHTMFETSDGVLVVMGAGTNLFKFTKNFDLTDPFNTSSALPAGFSERGPILYIRGVLGHYFPQGTNDKVKIFGAINAIAVTPDPL